MAETVIEAQEDLKGTYIFIGRIWDAYYLHGKVLAKDMASIPWEKYSIKETDFRVKTASFTTPFQLDLTTGLYLVKIVSRLHENFVGFILSDDFNEKDNSPYTYQCQDMSRQYQNKLEGIFGGATNYRILQSLLTRNHVPPSMKITDEIRKNFGYTWSGLRPLGLYEGKLYGNPISTNMMAQKSKIIVRNKSVMEAIRDICHGQGYVDVYFDENGVLQIEPLAIKDWQNTGLRLSANETSSRQFKFDTTNVITDVIIQNTDSQEVGKTYGAWRVTGLDLSSFFGVQMAQTSNPAQSTATNKATTNATTKKTTTTTKKDNPYGTKKKYLLIDADGGETVSFLENIAKHIRNGGWTVEIDKNIGPGAHSRNKGKVKKGCYMPVYNGLCAGTINEMPASYYGGVIKKNGSVLCPAWDTRSWTSSTMKQYRKGFTKLSYLKRAWDDNFSPSSFSGISNPAKFMTNHGIKYCVGDSAALIAKQFLAGGWVAYNKK